MAAMELHGTIEVNLEAALASARRLRGQPVYKDTVIYWTSLLDKARRARERRVLSDDAALDSLILRLESELTERERP